jgi:hypothetical protein
VVRLHYDKIGFAVLTIYLVLVLFCVLISYLHFTKKYAKNQLALKGYYANLQKLEEFYSQNKEETEDDTVIGA